MLTEVPRQRQLPASTGTNQIWVKTTWFGVDEERELPSSGCHSVFVFICGFLGCAERRSGQVRGSLAAFSW